MKVLTFILAALFWSVLMCMRLYIKSLLNSKSDPKHDENQKNKLLTTQDKTKNYKE